MLQSSIQPILFAEISDRDGHLVSGAEVAVAGLGCSKTDKSGVAKFYVPSEATYAMVIRYAGHQELLYEEWLTPVPITFTTRGR